MIGDKYDWSGSHDIPQSLHVNTNKGILATPASPVGALDKVFELVERNLSNEKRTEIHETIERIKDVPEDDGWSEGHCSVWSKWRERQAIRR
jgi:hypothetical protein